MKAIGIEKEEFDQIDNSRKVTYELENHKTTVARYDRFGVCLISRDLFEALIGLPQNGREMGNKEYSDIENALQSVVWYNSLYVELLEWKKVEPKNKTIFIQVEDEQLQVFYMMAVKMFGDCGTSPRTGWINDIEGFHKWIDDMCYDYFEAKENGLIEDE